MLTLEGLKEFGADTVKGLERCMNKEDFYFKLIGMALNDPKFEILKEAIISKDLDKAFEAAHALKGTTGNLSLDPIYEPVCEITELLRARTDTDYTELLEKVLQKKEELRALAEG